MPSAGILSRRRNLPRSPPRPRTPYEASFDRRDSPRHCAGASRAVARRCGWRRRHRPVRRGARRDRAFGQQSDQWPPAVRHDRQPRRIPHRRAAAGVVQNRHRRHRVHALRRGCHAQCRRRRHARHRAVGRGRRRQHRGRPSRDRPRPPRAIVNRDRGADSIAAGARPKFSAAGTAAAGVRAAQCHGQSLCDHQIRRRRRSTQRGDDAHRRRRRR